MTSNSRGTHRGYQLARGGSWGSATVELAIVAPILVMLLLGTIEVGSLVKDTLVLNSACREAARATCLGATQARAVLVAQAAAPTLQIQAVSLTRSFRTPLYGVWGDWAPLIDDANVNLAPVGSQVRVTLVYPHNLIAGPMFAGVITSSGNTVRLEGSLVMLRE